MEEIKNVLDLLTSIETLVDNSSTIPLSGKVVIDPEEILAIVSQIKRNLPDDVQQARWVRNEREKILKDAKEEYTKIMIAAKKDAEQLVEEHIITQQAKQRAEVIRQQADQFTKETKIEMYKYIDQLLLSFHNTMSDISQSYISPMVEQLSETFANIDNTVNLARQEMDKSTKEVLGEYTVSQNNVEYDD